MKGRIRVYEIEHDSDALNAAEWIRKAGATEAKIVETDFEGSESALFEVTVPDAVVATFQAAYRKTGFIYDPQEA